MNLHRRVVLAAAAATLARTGSAWAQAPARMVRIGLITTNPWPNAQPPQWVAIFAEGMRERGWVEGSNYVLDALHYDGHAERIPALAAELVQRRPDVIVATGSPPVRPLMQATQTIPIVFVNAGDPVGSGFVSNLARPGGNVTGLAFQVGPEIDAKRLELFREMIPGVSRIAFLANKAENSWESAAGKSVRAAAQAMGVTLLLAEAVYHDYADALAAVGRARAQALFVARSSHAFVNRALIIDFANRSRLPTSFDTRDFLAPGGLMSYGANPAHNFARAASYVDRILKGAKPSDLPIEQPTKYELLINLKTAKALGFTVPQSILLRADEVIQ